MVGPPDLVVEVSSPSTRRTDVVRKRRAYGPPSVVLAEGEVVSTTLPGLVLPAAEALALEGA